MKKLALVSGLLLAMVSAGAGSLQAAVYTDDFNSYTPNIQLWETDNWTSIRGDSNLHETISGGTIGLNWTPGEGTVVGDKFVAATHTTETYQKAGIDFKVSQFTGQNQYIPGFSLNLNFGGTNNYYYSAHTYRIWVRGNMDMWVQKLADDGGWEIASGPMSFGANGLNTNSWYRMEIEKNGNVITGWVKNLDGSVVTTTSITDTGVQFTGGSVAIVENYGATVPAIVYDNFSYQLGAVPEPASMMTLVLMLCGVAAQGLRMRRKG